MKHNTLRLFGMVAICIGMSGCSRSIDPPADPDQAKDAMKVALEAWKKGEAAESLATRTPPIQFTDARWANGNKLLEYKVLEVRLDGRMQRFRIELTMEDKEGSRQVQEVDYIADTGAKVVINQADIES